MDILSDPAVIWFLIGLGLLLLELVLPGLVILFFGGWGAPIEMLVWIPPIICFFVKVALFIYFFMWVRFTLPRYRYDQLMQIGWKVLIPLSMANIIVTGLLRIEF